jgi:predicted nucleic acid-binding protein
MIAAIDSCVLLCILGKKPGHELWMDRIVNLRQEGYSLTICEIVFAEISNNYESKEDIFADLADLGVSLDSTCHDGLFTAGQYYAIYCKARKNDAEKQSTLRRALPDFIVGAHASIQTNGLATADGGYQRSYFDNLKLFQLLPENR